MSNISLSVERIIISMIPENPSLHLVCKDWNKCVMEHKVKSVVYISKWWSKFVNDEKSLERKGFLRHKIRLYDDEAFLSIPEFTVRKLNLNTNLLLSIPNDRKKSDIVKWVLRNDNVIGEDGWSFVGL